MGSFFKMFFASLLALVIFCLIVVFITIGFFAGVASKKAPKVHDKSVLVLDLGQEFHEQTQNNFLSAISDAQSDVPGLYDVVRLITIAKDDKKIAGIYIIANGNPNGFAASEEIRNALNDFKTSKKFVLAHGDVITQKAYSIANVSDSIFVSQQGYVEWSGFSVTYAFLKGTLDKLGIEPQVFYAGKFKSATEPFRTDRMTPENQLQTSIWLNDLYNHFLLRASEARRIDTATLHRLANEGTIRTAADAVQHKLVDALKYDDEVKDVIKRKLGIDKYERINYITINSYQEANEFDRKGKEKIALIYAEGDIMDGKGDQGMIGSESYRNLIRKARLDRSIKAIVLRVNSGGGSALASENIWRELSLAKTEKPVVVSFGDVAASGGYYIACAADSIFCQPVTITGSIGVFGIIPNMQSFFKDKLGVTFDGVKTAPHADAGAVYRPLTEKEKQMTQAGVEVTYAQFKQRVADGRKKDTAYVDSIAQGRVWTGVRAREIGLVDKFGGLDAAVKCAARMAKLTDYALKELPEQQTLFEQLFGKKEPMTYANRLKAELGEENYKIYLEMKRVREMTNTVQARLPFQFFIH
jgi:protease IV